MQQEIYLDNAATTPVLSEVVDEIVECLTRDFGNPSSLHRLGLQSEKRMKDARGVLAQTLQVEPDNIIFTSGGTEANNLAVLGTIEVKKRYGTHCITTQIEHPSILNTFHFMEQEGWKVTYLPVDRSGIVSLEDLDRALTSDTVLVSIMHVNNEIGSIQPIEEIGAYLKNYDPKIVFHVDAVQSFGRLGIRPIEWSVDLLSLSGHKIHAPKGIGALYIGKDVHLKPLQWGGGQEKGFRGGTENLPGIAGLARAVQWINKASLDPPLIKKKKALVDGIGAIVPEAVVNGPNAENGAPHILNVSIPGIRGEVLLHVLESHGVYVSTGSACSSKRVRTSHVLKAIGASTEIAEGAIRISLSHLNNLDEINRVPEILRKSVDQVKRFTRR